VRYERVADADDGVRCVEHSLLEIFIVAMMAVVLPAVSLLPPEQANPQ